MNVARTCAALAIALWAAVPYASASAVGRRWANKRLPLKQTWPWYHSGDEIQSELQQLVGNCAGANVDFSQRSELNSGSAAGQLVNLDVMHISRSGSGAKTRAMLIFGEHARELISPESALHFTKALCGVGPDAARASHVLDNVSFTIVPNANPIARKKVEDGYYCKRTNEDGVDLNRNFGDAHRDASMEKAGDEQNPGPSGFSEPETRILKGLIDEEKPDIYLSVHSGAYLLGTPFGYTSDRTPDDEDKMMQVLQPISDKYCDGLCPYGNLAELIHYENPGCDIDYVSEQGSPYVFTWEIYVGEDFRGRYEEEARMRKERKPRGASFLQQRGAASLRGGRASRSSSRRAPEDEELIDSCLDQFNPQSQDETEAVVGRWTGAYLELCEEVSSRKSTAAAADAAATTNSPFQLSLQPVAETADTSVSNSSAPSAAAAWPALDDLVKKLA